MVSDTVQPDRIQRRFGVTCFFSIFMVLYFTSTTKVRLWNKEEVGSCLNVCNHVPDYTAAHSARLNSVRVLVIECLNVLCISTD